MRIQEVLTVKILCIMRIQQVLTVKILCILRIQDVLTVRILCILRSQVDTHLGSLGNRSFQWHWSWLICSEYWVNLNFNMHLTFALLFRGPYIAYYPVMCNPVM